MSYQAIIDQCEQAYHRLAEIDTDRLLSNPGGQQPWNGLDFDDFSYAFSDVIQTLNNVFEFGALEGLPFNILQNLTKNLNACTQHCQQFVDTRSQKNFHQAFQQIEGLRAGINNWGLSYRMALGEDIQTKVRRLDSQTQKIIDREKRIDDLVTRVEALIEPAVAGSLSKSFSDRQKALHDNEKKWYVASVVMALVSILATIVIVWSLVGFFESASQMRSSDSVAREELAWAVILLRLAVLLPVYSLFVFTFVQYKRERELEEGYAHKAAVATSLELSRFSGQFPILALRSSSHASARRRSASSTR